MTFQKTRDKKKIPKGSGDKKQVTHKGTEIRRALNFSTAVPEARLCVFKFRQKILPHLEFYTQTSMNAKQNIIQTCKFFKKNLLLCIIPQKVTR